jgi:sulfur carrier protein
MDFVINGHARSFPDLAAGSTVQELVTALRLKSDRLAIEHNGAIVPRAGWSSTPLADGDKFEMVHFVGGGTM